MRTSPSTVSRSSNWPATCFPSATVEDKVASGYNRLGMMSAEGGVQPKEYLAKYIAERVRNVSGTWLGATFGCCECHNHKFDPFLAKDFYSLEAFFADIEERGLYSGADRDGSWGPSVQLPTPAQEAERDRLAREMAAVRKSLDTPSPAPRRCRSDRGSTKSTRSFRRRIVSNPGDDRRTSDRTPSGRNWPPITARSRRRSMRRARNWRTSSAPQPSLRAANSVDVDHRLGHAPHGAAPASGKLDGRQRPRARAGLSGSPVARQAA